MPWIAYVLGGVPGALLAVLAASGVVSERVALALFAPSFIVLNLAHMAAAWDHAYLDQPGWRAAPVERVLIPALLVAGSLGLEAVGWAALLLALQYWLSLHHAAMQNYGILRSTQRGRGRRLDQAACVLLPLGALAYRARVICAKYDGATVPTPPAWLAPLLMGAGAVALLLFVVRARRNPLGLALVVGMNALWTGLLVGLSHPALPLYALASGHYIQQLYFVWRSQPVRRWTPLRYLALLTAAGGGVVFLLTLATVGARALAANLRSPSALAIPPWVAAMIGVNLWHYWLESRIWRRASVAPLHGLPTQS